MEGSYFVVCVHGVDGEIVEVHYAILGWTLKDELSLWNGGIELSW